MKKKILIIGNSRLRMATRPHTVHTTIYKLYRYILSYNMATGRLVIRRHTSYRVLRLAIDVSHQKGTVILIICN